MKYESRENWGASTGGFNRVWFYQNHEFYMTKAIENYAKENQHHIIRDDDREIVGIFDDSKNFHILRPCKTKDEAEAIVQKFFGTIEQSIKHSFDKKVQEVDEMTFQEFYEFMKKDFCLTSNLSAQRGYDKAEVERKLEVFNTGLRVFEDVGEEGFQRLRDLFKSGRMLDTRNYDGYSFTRRALVDGVEEYGEIMRNFNNPKNNEYVESDEFKRKCIEDFAILKNISGFDKFYIEGDRIIGIHKPVTLDGYNLGGYLIAYKSGTDWSVGGHWENRMQASRIKDGPFKPSASTIHPHISSNLSFCWGNLSPQIRQSSYKCEVSECFAIANMLVKSYNEEDKYDTPERITQNLCNHYFGR